MRTTALPARILALALAALGFGLFPSCGGGGGGGGTVPPGLAATFTAQTPSPGSNTVSLQPGTASGDIFRVRVVATGVNDFFGTAFRITFSTASAQYQGVDHAASFLRDGGADTTFTVDGTTQPGTLIVSATRLQNAAGTVPGVNVTGSRDLMVLTFRATQATSGNTFAFADPREVRDSTQPAPGGLINVAWPGGTMVAN
jgi:hypothetical protein